VFTQNPALKPDEIDPSLHKIVNRRGEFQPLGYKKAVDAFKGDKEKKLDKFGPKTGAGAARQFNPQAVRGLK
jgi:hypothetical protein